MKIVIGGCRNYNNYESFCSSMDMLLQKHSEEEHMIISGHCSGVDMLAKDMQRKRVIR